MRRGVRIRGEQRGDLGIVAPVADIDTRDALRLGSHINGGAEFLERAQIVDPQPYGVAVLLRELPGQAPAHADVAIVVDDAAENIPGGDGAHEVRQGRPEKADIVVGGLFYTDAL